MVKWITCYWGNTYGKDTWTENRKKIGKNISKELWIKKNWEKILIFIKLFWNLEERDLMSTCFYGEVILILEIPRLWRESTIKRASKYPIFTLAILQLLKCAIFQEIWVIISYFMGYMIIQIFTICRRGNTRTRYPYWDKYFFFSISFGKTLLSVVKSNMKLSQCGKYSRLKQFFISINLWYSKVWRIGWRSEKRWDNISHIVGLHFCIWTTSRTWLISYETYRVRW